MGVFVYVFDQLSVFIFIAQASTYQMGVLLMLNSGDSYTIEQIQEQTQLKKVTSLPMCLPNRYNTDGFVVMVLILLFII
jgi:hypothetical protein